MAKKTYKITERQLNEMVGRVVTSLIREGALRDYFRDVRDNAVAGYNMGDGEPENWENALARCGYDLVGETGNYLICQKRYGFMGTDQYIDKPEDVPSALARFGKKVAYAGSRKGYVYFEVL